MNEPFIMGVVFLGVGAIVGWVACEAAEYFFKNRGKKRWKD
ncbi:MAG: hypothetical protein AB7D96_10590 [Arcobacteraceae bacterium]